LIDQQPNALNDIFPEIFSRCLVQRGNIIPVTEEQNAEEFLRFEVEVLRLLVGNISTEGEEPNGLYRTIVWHIA
jgi:hypothetical protein